MAGILRPFLIFAALLLALLPTAATFASSAEGASPGIFSGDIGNVFWTLVIFFIVLFVLGKYAWGPILERLQAREDFIHEALAKADKAQTAAEAQFKEYEAKLAQARAEATAIVEEGRRDAEVVKQKIESDARTEAQTMLVRAKREIEIARDTAIKDLYGVAGKLAIGVAGKIIGEQLKESDHERLIADAIEQIEGRSASN
jgi:F-type H+-transporting ATPase subunit b